MSVRHARRNVGHTAVVHRIREVLVEEVGIDSHRHGRLTGVFPKESRHMDCARPNPIYDALGGFESLQEQ